MSSVIWEPVLRTALVFMVVFTLTRILGQKQISQLTFFDYVAGTAIGSLAASAMSNPMIPLITNILCFLTWAGLLLLLHTVRMASVPVQKLLEGQPRVVIRDGQILEEVLRAGLYNINDLLTQLRENGVFDPREVEVGIIETNGQLSILKKTGSQSLTAKNPYKQNGEQAEIQFDTKELIVDGEIMRQNVISSGLTEAWLERQLLEQGIDGIKQVALAMLTPSGKLYVDKRSDEI